MEAMQLVESVIKAAQDEHTLMLRATKSTAANTMGDRLRLVPVLYRKVFILVYYGEFGQNDDEFSVVEGGQLKYGGFIFMRTKQWYDSCYYMLSRLTDGDFQGIVGTQGRTAWTKECEDLFRQRITEYFLNSEDSKKPYNPSGYRIDSVFSLIVSHVNVAEMTLYDLTKSCNFDISEKINEFRYLEDANDYVNKLVVKSYDFNKKQLRQKQAILCQMKEDYEKLKKNISHPIWKKEEMARVIPDVATKVNVTFKIGGCLITEKVKTALLTCGEKTELTGHDLPLNVSAILKASHTGAEAEFIEFSAIEIISYRNETLYCKRDFARRLEKQNLPPKKEEDTSHDM